MIVALLAERDEPDLARVEAEKADAPEAPATPEDKPADAPTETPKAEQPVEALTTPEGKPTEVAAVPEAAERKRVYDLAKGLRGW